MLKKICRFPLYRELDTNKPYWSLRKDKDSEWRYRERLPYMLAARQEPPRVILVFGRVMVLFTFVLMVLRSQLRINTDRMKAYFNREEFVVMGVVNVGNRVELTKQQHSQGECGQQASAYGGKANHGVIPPRGI